MTESGHFTVMGPAPTPSDTAMPGMNPQWFETNKTNKINYSDSIMTWEEIVRSFDKVDQKSKSQIETMGLMIYLTCDHGAKAKLRAE